ncbi:MAG: hypothetical protein N2316_03980 [Spirochaetes bacterium]|nr:hypothetical protein [Spirochaetota bacterium]
MLFKNRREIFHRFSNTYLMKRIMNCRDNLTGSYYPHRAFDEVMLHPKEKLYDDGMQCPFVILMDDNTIGCAIYPHRGDSDMRFDCFQNYTCKYFSCISHELLSDDEILYAARLFRDWYYYSLFIHSIDLLKTFKCSHPIPEAVDNLTLELLKQKLESSLIAEKNLHCIHGYFA